MVLDGHFLFLRLLRQDGESDDNCGHSEHNFRIKLLQVGDIGGTV